ncbi:Beta-1,3-galactosyltransferase bre-2 [Dirofilaria immitis]
MFYRQKRWRKKGNIIGVLIAGALFIFLYHQKSDKNDRLYDLSEFWSNINVSKNFTMEFMDESIKSSILILPNIEACKQGPKYLVVIISRTSSFDIRNAIRDTWINPNNSNILRNGFVVAYFLVGMKSDTMIMMKIIEESKKYNDLIVTSIEDIYETLTLKVYTAMYFKETYCQNVTYYIKVDDDVVLDLDRLDQQIISLSNLAYIYGAIRYKEAVIRQRMSKYFIPYKCYSRNFYPPFALGMMYIIPREAFRKIWHALPMAVWLKLEDIFYTGIVADIASVKRINIDFMYSANNVQNLPDQWECDQHGQSKLVAVSSFCNSNDLRKFYRKLHGTKCLKYKNINSSFIETFWQKFEKILSKLYH